MPSRTVHRYRHRSPTPLHFDDSGYYGDRDEVVTHIFFNRTDPPSFDEDGNRISTEEVTPRSQPGETSCYHDLRRLARQARRRCRYLQRPLQRRFVPGYFRMHQPTYGFPRDRCGEFESDGFWRTTWNEFSTYSNWDLNSYPYSEARHDYTGRTQCRADVHYWTRVVPEMEIYNNDDNESEVDDDDYYTFSYEELAEMRDELVQQLQPAERANLSSSSRPNVNFWDQDHRWGPGYSSPTDSWDDRVNGFTRAQIRERRIERNLLQRTAGRPRRHRSTPAPNLESDDEGNDSAHWRVQGYEGDYVDWSSDDSRGNAGNTTTHAQTVYERRRAYAIAQMDAFGRGISASEAERIGAGEEEEEREEEEEEEESDNESPEDRESSENSFSDEGITASDDSSNGDQEPRVVLTVVNGSDADNEDSDDEIDPETIRALMVQGAGMMRGVNPGESEGQN
ncbi:hypothetical protein TWF281_000393 [Arthrobotrys megalospora]